MIDIVSTDDPNVTRIANVVEEHYNETSGEVLSILTTHVLNDKVYIVQIVVSYESDASYIIHTETVRVDVADALTFTLLSENDLDLTSEL